MLALPDVKEDFRTNEASSGNEQDNPIAFASFSAGNVSGEEENLKPLKTLTRSKSLPGSFTSLDTNKGEVKVPEELTKSKSLKWSLKGKVSNLLFSRNKKASKEKSYEESQMVNTEILDSLCNDASVSARSMDSREGGLSISKLTTFGNSSEWRDEPSSILARETSFDEDDYIFFNFPVLNKPPSSLEPERSKLLGKSPPIGSISRTLSFDDSTVA